MFSNSLKIITIDGNTLEIWQTVCKKYNFNIWVFVGFIVWIVYSRMDTNNFKTAF
jgi:hypothetical protein